MSARIGPPIRNRDELKAELQRKRDKAMKQAERHKADGWPVTLPAIQALSGEADAYLYALCLIEHWEWIDADIALAGAVGLGDDDPDDSDFDTPLEPVQPAAAADAEAQA